eukprot:GHVP01054165.1.p1 GENE.GHVP01054165.1~~GHVP01054165.1.p1  ORF type:complete len:217 (+),score=41.55 GHVP01054165.1:30-653(+)
MQNELNLPEIFFVTGSNPLRIDSEVLTSTEDFDGPILSKNDARLTCSDNPGDPQQHAELSRKKSAPIQIPKYVPADVTTQSLTDIRSRSGADQPESPQDIAKYLKDTEYDIALAALQRMASNNSVEELLDVVKDFPNKEITSKRLAQFITYVLTLNGNGESQEIEITEEEEEITGRLISWVTPPLPKNFDHYLDSDSEEDIFQMDGL